MQPCARRRCPWRAFQEISFLNDFSRFHQLPDLNTWVNFQAIQPIYLDVFGICLGLHTLSSKSLKV
jgi:hypothetical protein